MDTDWLERFLCTLGSQEQTVVGHISRQGTVLRHGKWAEYQYRADEEDAVYPPFALGSYGHAVSRDIAAAVVDMDGLNYQGEDVSLGIWLDQSSFRNKVKWIDGAGFVRKDEDEYKITQMEGVMVLSSDKRRKDGVYELSLCPMAHKIFSDSAPEWAVPLSHVSGQTVYLRAEQSLILAWRINLDAVQAEAARSGLDGSVRIEGLEFGLVVDGELLTFHNLPAGGSTELTFRLNPSFGVGATWGLGDDVRLGLQVTMRGQDGPIGRMTEKMELLVREFQDRVVAENAGIDVGRKNSGEAARLD